MEKVVNCWYSAPALENCEIYVNQSWFIWIMNLNCIFELNFADFAIYHGLIHDSWLPSAVCQEVCNIISRYTVIYEQPDESLIGQIEHNINQGFFLMPLLWYQKDLMKHLQYYHNICIHGLFLPQSMNRLGYDLLLATLS